MAFHRSINSIFLSIPRDLAKFRCRLFGSLIKFSVKYWICTPSANYVVSFKPSISCPAFQLLTESDSISPPRARIRLVLSSHTLTSRQHHSPWLNSMRRRSSDSAEEDEFRNAIPAEPTTPNHDEKRRSFTSAKYDVSRHSDTLDRRKAEKIIPPSTFIANGSIAPVFQEAPPKLLPLSPEQNGSKMQESRGRRPARQQTPWSISLLTLSATILAVVLLFSIIHSFLSRQVDSKGCDMCYTREIIYFEFRDFDTEHTRFATKYSLHLIREEGFDEDPKVRFG